MEIIKKQTLSETFSVYFDRRMIRILLLGIISGFPWVLIGSSLSLWLKEDGLSRSGLGIMFDWSLAVNTPEILSIPNISEWIFDYPTAAGSRAIMIGIALGIIATSFRIILGIEKPF